MHICRYTYGLDVHPKTFADACDVHILFFAYVYTPKCGNPWENFKAKPWELG